MCRGQLYGREGGRERKRGEVGEVGEVGFWVRGRFGWEVGWVVGEVGAGSVNGQIGGRHYGKY